VFLLVALGTVHVSEMLLEFWFLLPFWPCCVPSWGFYQLAGCQDFRIELVEAGIV
jgi:hypothetical protein